MAKNYQHKVQYYETDQMGIVHHSNYLRWFEEARTELFDQMGMPYAELEKEGLIVPVTRAECKYSKPCYYGETLEIEVRFHSLRKFLFKVDYKVKGLEDQSVRCTGSTQHAILSADGDFVHIEKDYPNLYKEWQVLFDPSS